MLYEVITEPGGEDRIAISDIPEPEDDRIELDELRRVFIETMLRSYQRKYQPEAILLA